MPLPSANAAPGQDGSRNMPPAAFVPCNSIVRTIWGKSDTILFIFAGAAAEFSLNKAVDWLYFTGRLPADPIGRLFSTVAYARQIIFDTEAKALAAIDRIQAIHAGVEAGRGSRIPDWAYRDVLYMLIHYSIASFELLERGMTLQEREEVYRVFLSVGNRMHIPGLPADYRHWMAQRRVQLKGNLVNSPYTADLYRQYRKHLGPLRYYILLQVQSRLLPAPARQLLRLEPSVWVPLLLPVYKVVRRLKLDRLLKSLLVPAAYRSQVKELDITT